MEDGEGMRVCIMTYGEGIITVTKEFLVTIVITMPVATDIATTFQLRDKVATRDNG